MATVMEMTGIVLAGSIHLPPWVRDFTSFRRWTLSEEYPDRGEISYLGNLLWIDPSMERDIHNQLKLSIATDLLVLERELNSGRVYTDKMRLVHPEAGLSTEADAAFISKESWQRQRVQLKEGKNSLELIGSVDMALEVVSPSSVQKDTVLLLDLYHRAGVREYWLINPLGDSVDFKIYRWSARKFVPVRPKNGWLRSDVFARSFRLTETLDGLGLPKFCLEVASPPST